MPVELFPQLCHLASLFSIRGLYYNCLERITTRMRTVFGRSMSSERYLMRSFHFPKDLALLSVYTVINRAGGNNGARSVAQVGDSAKCPLLYEHLPRSALKHDKLTPTPNTDTSHTPDTFPICLAASPNLPKISRLHTNCSRF
jgi:hypothetical protein